MVLDMSHIINPPTPEHIKIAQTAAHMDIQAELHRRFLDYDAWWNGFFWISLGALLAYVTSNPKRPQGALLRCEIEHAAAEVYDITTRVALEALRLDDLRKETISKSTKETKPPS